jgi:hypothetical protein
MKKLSLVVALILFLASCKTPETTEPTGCFIVTTTCQTSTSYASGDQEFCGVTESDIKKTIHNTAICTSTYRKK